MLPEGFRIPMALMEKSYYTLFTALPEGSPSAPKSGDAFEEDMEVLVAQRIGIPRNVALDGELFESFAHHARTVVFGCGKVDDMLKEHMASDILSNDPKAIERGPGAIGSSAHALNDLLRNYRGRELDPASRSELCWRIAAGRDQLAMGRSLQPRFVPLPPEWTGVRIEDSRFGKILNGKGGPVQTLALVMRAIGGVFAGLTFTQLMPYRYVMFKLAREIGFPVFKKLDKNDLVQGYFVGRLDPAGRYGPEVLEFDTTDSIRDHNRKVYKDRQKPCLKEFSWPCVKCTVGHMWSCKSEDVADVDRDNQCRRGTHSRTYVQRTCEKCETDSWFEPDVASTMCLNCQNTAAKKQLSRAR